MADSSSKSDFRLACIYYTAELFKEENNPHPEVRKRGIITIQEMCTVPFAVLVAEVMKFSQLIELLKTSDNWPPPENGN